MYEQTIADLKQQNYEAVQRLREVQNETQSIRN